MKFHFSWTISANDQMELESRLAIAAAKNLAHCTIWAQESEFAKVSERLKAAAEVLPYAHDPAMVLPWSSTPKWGVKPQGDVLVGLDADVIVWRQDKVREAAELCLSENAVCGTLAYAPPFPADEWRSLLFYYGLEAQLPFHYSNTDEPSPFYINNGCVMMPASLLDRFRDSFYKYLPELNVRYPGLYYMCQVATTIAILKAGLRVRAMPITFNYLENTNAGLPLLSEAAFLHYNSSRDNPFNAQHPQVRDRMRELEKEPI
jgi:hypothetical protein